MTQKLPSPKKSSAFLYGPSGCHLSGASEGEGNSSIGSSEILGSQTRPSKVLSASVGQQGVEYSKLPLPQKSLAFG